MGVPFRWDAFSLPKNASSFRTIHQRSMNSERTPPHTAMLERVWVCLCVCGLDILGWARFTRTAEKNRPGRKTRAKETRSIPNLSPAARWKFSPHTPKVLLSKPPGNDGESVWDREKLVDGLRQAYIDWILKSKWNSFENTTHSVVEAFFSSPPSSTVSPRQDVCLFARVNPIKLTTAHQCTQTHTHTQTKTFSSPFGMPFPTGASLLSS